MTNNSNENSGGGGIIASFINDNEVLNDRFLQSVSDGFKLKENTVKS